MAIKTKGIETPNFFRALQRFQDTFKAHMDQTSEQTSFPGMGELHLEIYMERMKREYNVDCTTGKPRVNFRETTGGAGQYARVVGHIEPTEYDLEPGKDVGFENVVMDASIPSNLILIPAVEKGFYEASEKGSLSGTPISGCRLVLKEGAFHAVESSELAFRLATIGTVREAYKSARPVILEPFMTVMEFKNRQPVLPNQQKQLAEAPRKTSPCYTQLESRQEYHRAIEYVDAQFTELEG
ncbi:Ribosomal protein S5 domain 2-type fold [Amanita muscaria]